MQTPDANPRPRPPAGQGRFLEVAIPPQFVVESLDDHGAWVAGNGYLAEDCARLDDGSYCCGNRSGGSPLWIRCVAVLDDSFIHLDGGGRPFRYRLVAVGD